MFYLESFERQHAESIPLLSSCAYLHSDPILYVRLSGDILGVNELCLSFLRCKTMEEMRPMAEWLHPIGVELLFLLSQPGSYRGKIEINGSEMDVAIRSETVILGDDPIVGVAFRDTSVIERAKAAERYFDQFKKRFLTNISHEFRTPMNAIIGFTDLLKGTPLSSWQKEYVEMASKSASSMMRNIENLLELMQVESGSVHTSLQLFNPVEALETFSVQFKELADAKEIQLLIMIDPTLPKMVLGDQDKIFTILRNLIQNAIKFTDSGGQVMLEAVVVKKNGKSVEVEYALSDTGVGIESEKVKTLLRPFASAWENQRRGKDGLGIGLSLSHKYVDMMDSHLMLASQPGIGSRFSFRIHHVVREKAGFGNLDGIHAAIYSQDASSAQSALLQRYLELFNVDSTPINTFINPILHEINVLFIDALHISKSQIDALKATYPHLQVVPIINTHEGMNALLGVEKFISLPILPTSVYRSLSAVRRDESLLEEKKETNEESTVNREIKILVAEDNLINLRLLETILLQEHFKVTAVDNGQKAVDAYLEEPFDLVLMDIDMPIMDGLTANRLIKEIDKRDNRGFTPVIALTAHALIGDRERIVAAGLDAHLAKPIDKNFLLQTIERYLKIAQQKRLGIAV